MANIFLIDPTLVEQATEIVRVRSHGDGKVAVATAVGIARPGGGGQPADKVELHWRGRCIPVAGILKADGETWLVLDDAPEGLAVGEPVEVKLDAERRSILSRYHSLAHVLQGCARAVVVGHASRGADIRGDASALEVRFTADSPVGQAEVAEIDRRARSVIAAGRPVTAHKVRSPEEGAARFPNWRLDPELGLSGKMRVIDIDTLDSNPCSGTHVANTAQIGPFSLLSHTVDGRGVHRLVASIETTWLYWYAPAYT